MIYFSYFPYLNNFSLKSRDSIGGNFFFIEKYNEKKKSENRIHVVDMARSSVQLIVK